MTNQQPTTQTTEAPTQPTLPGMEDVRTGSDSDWVPRMDDLEAENAQLKVELHMRTAIYDIKTKLKAAGARSPNLLAKQAKDRFQFDEDGDVTNAD